ncbi:ParA family protein [Crateriforma conspicua]|uniref:MinD/ParA/CobQ/CobA-like protein n=1 Tax=Crateriforma conspicua TaxID=2527996 RepID=A0A5C6FCR9_9PLAN|nr:ParA family protein [Crateriforma conspicua]TWU59503.1 MinD/ParA/CobQ/CobA-like protein [Crateriforma conspicua]
MSLRESYAVWNNKGGVGKSTITFHIAARFAEQNPDTNVLVIDLCPQANSSMMLLGGGNAGETHVLNFCTEPTPRSVVGYLSNVLAAGSGAPLPDPNSFIVQVSNHNEHLTDNLYLLPGDGNLEPMAPAISGAAAQPPLTPQAQPWRWVHMVFRELIDNLVAQDTDQEWLVLVDTNPSFSIYTELAMCAVNRLITPVNADDSSRVATNAMFILLHGQNPPHPVYGSWTFASRAPQFGIQIPQIHLVVGNRLTQYQGAATAFAALSDATADTLFHAYQTHPTYFTDRDSTATSVQQFRDLYSVPLRDFNTAGVVAAHLGQRLSNLTGRHYPVHGTQVQLVRDRIDECISAIDAVTSRL